MRISGRQVTHTPNYYVMAFDIPTSCVISGTFSVEYTASIPDSYHYTTEPPQVIFATASSATSGIFPPPYTEGGSFKSSLVLGEAFLAELRQAAAQTILIGVSPSYAYDGSTFSLSLLRFELDELEGARWPKSFSFHVQDGRAICGYVDTDSALYIATSGSLKTALAADGNKSVWAAPYALCPLATVGAVAIHPGRGRAQCWYIQYVSPTQTNALVSFSPTGGVAQDWTPPVPPTSPQPAIFNLRYDYGGPAYFETGTDGRLYAADMVCTDDGQGVIWAAADTQSAGGRNSVGGGPVALPYAGVDANRRVFNVLNPGKYLETITGLQPGGFLAGRAVASGAVVAATPIARAKNGAAYQLIFTTQYSRLRPVKQSDVPTLPPVGGITPVAAAGSVGILNDPASSDPQTIHYQVDVPDDVNAISRLRLNWQQQLYTARKPLKGRYDNPKTPTKVTFDIPPFPQVPRFQPGNPATFTNDVTYITGGYVLVNFTYKGAKSARVHVGAKFKPKDPKNPSSHDSGDPIGQGCTLFLEGNGEYGAQPLPLPALNQSGQIQLDASHLVDIDKARGSSITFDVETLGSAESPTHPVVGEIVYKDCYFYYTYIVLPGPALTVETLAVKSAQPGSMAPVLRLGGGNGGQTATEFYMSSDNTPNAGALLDEVDGRHGNTWLFDLIFTPGTYADGTPRHYNNVLLDSYAQFCYALEQPDWYLARSIDGGANWEFVNDAQPITQLSPIRDWNNTYSTLAPVVPTLLTDNDVLYLCWVMGTPGETHPVRTLASQDHGATWVVGPSSVA